MTNDMKDERYLRYEDGKVFWQYPDGSHRGISEMDVIGINALSEHVRAAAGTEPAPDVGELVAAAKRATDHLENAHSLGPQVRANNRLEVLGMLRTALSRYDNEVGM